MIERVRACVCICGVENRRFLAAAQEGREVTSLEVSLWFGCHHLYCIQWTMGLVDLGSWARQLRLSPSLPRDELRIGTCVAARIRELKLFRVSRFQIKLVINWTTSESNWNILDFVSLHDEAWRRQNWMFAHIAIYTSFITTIAYPTPKVLRSSKPSKTGCLYCEIVARCFFLDRLTTFNKKQPGRARARIVKKKKCYINDVKNES